MTAVTAVEKRGRVANLPAQQLLHQAFAFTAKRLGNKLAFIDSNTGRRLTYKESLIAALLLARYLKRFDDHYIGVLLPNSAGSTLAVLAILFAGKVPVMINYSTGAEQNCRYAREKCGFRTIISAGALLKKINCPQLDDMILIEQVLGSLTALQKVRAALKSMLPLGLLLAGSARAKPDDTAVIMFTSGSEKSPKGVELSHRNIYADVRAMCGAVTLYEDDIMLSILPLFHVFGFTVTFWMPMVTGMTVVIYGNPLDFKKVAQLIKDEKPTLQVATPYFLSGYLKQSQPGDFSSLRLVIAGADKCPEGLYKDYQAQHGLEVHEGYGATETSPVASVNTFGANKPGSLGKPLPGVQVRIVDLNDGSVLGVDEEGKIQIKGDTVMKGYFQDVEETALHIEDGWYETGDMGVIDSDGFLWHRGRLKRFVKIGGEMVSLVRLEMELEKLLPNDCECCAVEIPGGKRGAQIAVAVNREVDGRALKEQLQQQLPAISLPKAFYVLDELPKMGSGKIDFRAATEQVRQRIESE